MDALLASAPRLVNEGIQEEGVEVDQPYWTTPLLLPM